MKCIRFNLINTTKQSLIMIGLLIAIISCNSDITSDTETTTPIINREKSGYKITENEAIENLLKFMTEMNKSSDDKVSLKSKSIRKVEKIEILGKNNKTTTYASKNRNKSLSLNDVLANINEDSLFYLINFQDNAGYAIISADERSNIIYAIIDEGSLRANTEVDNPGFIMYMENAIENEFNKIGTYNNEILNKNLKSQSLPFYIKEVRAPKLQTKWGQGVPYNIYCPNGITGCVMTATAQILSYFQTFNGANYRDNYYNVNSSFNLDWNTIISDCENTSTSLYGRLTNNHYQSSRQIAHLMRYLGIEVGATYYTDGSGTGAVSATAINWLEQSGGVTTTSFETFDKRNAFIALKGGLVYMKARRRIDSGSTVGHAWVIDGGMYGLVTEILINPDTKISTSTTHHYYYMHCNWGWNGECDGYYYNGFNVAGGPTFMEDIDISSSSDKDYNIQQEMSMIHKRWQQ